MIRSLLLLIIVVTTFSVLPAQSLYFPPLVGANWETVDPNSLGWCTDKIDSLLSFVGEKNSKAFIVLKDGKIAIEKYYGSFTKDSLWYWASAGKTLTSMLTGIAQQEGFLSISDKSSKFQGVGWTVCPPAKEDLITVRHQLTMTSGLDDGGPDNHCLIDSCLVYLADAGKRWAYHNAPYTLLDKVIENATGKNFSLYFNDKIRSKIGMNGIWFKSGYDNVYLSNARSMARYGLLVLNKGKWMTNPIIADTAYFNEMVNSSQSLNNSYGYLWWLNGKSSFMLPESQFVFPGYLMTDAPKDLIAALGKNGQCLNVVPSMNLVVIRMGDAPGNTILDVANFFNNDIWKRLNDVICNSTATEQVKENTIMVYPNPVKDELRINISQDGDFSVSVYNIHGQLQVPTENKDAINLRGLAAGIYLARIKQNSGVTIVKFIKE